MKGAFESFLIFYLGFLFVLLGFSMVEITMKYNNARMYQESIVSLIERHNRYDSDIKNLIKENSKYCQTCTYTVVGDFDKYLVTINFDVDVSVLNYSRKASIRAYTQSLQ